MTFSLISVAILVITALVIVIEAVRAINRGRQKTLVTLASIFLSVFISILITKFLSDLFAKFVVKFIKSAVNLTEITEKIASTDDILFAYADAVVAPLTFLAVFLVVRLIVALVIKLVYKINKKAGEGKIYEYEDAPNSKKKPKLINGLLGALCGFMIMVITVSPLMGTLKIATTAFKNMNKPEASFNVRIKDEALWYFDGCAADLIGNIYYYSGGILVYKSVATSELNDNYFELGKEVDDTFATAGDLMRMGTVLNNLSTATEDDKNMLRNLGSNVDKTETLKAATADILPVLAKEWMNDKPYDGMAKPKVSKASESFFDKMLYICTKSTPDTVGADLSSLLNVYLIAFEKEILISENYKDMIEKAKMNGAFDLIKAELAKNPRMTGLDLELDNMTMKSIASAIQSFNLDNYDTLMNNMNFILNNAIKLEGQQRMDYVTQLTKNYINQHGIDLGDDVVNEISERLIDELVDHRTSVTVDDIKAFWDKYSVTQKNNSNISGDNNAQTTPENENSSVNNEPNNEPDIEEEKPADEDISKEENENENGENIGGENSEGENNSDDVEIFPEDVTSESDNSDDFTWAVG